MFLVIEMYDGMNSITPFRCKEKAKILKEKITAKGGEARIKVLLNY